VKIRDIEYSKFQRDKRDSLRDKFGNCKMGGGVGINKNDRKKRDKECER